MKTDDTDSVEVCDLFFNLHIALVSCRQPEGLDQSRLFNVLYASVCAGRRTGPWL